MSCVRACGGGDERPPTTMTGLGEAPRVRDDARCDAVFRRNGDAMRCAADADSIWDDEAAAATSHGVRIEQAWPAGGHSSKQAREAVFPRDTGVNIK